MKDAQKTTHISLSTLINYLKEGRFVIPDFQREFAWKSSDIKDLVRSIFLDYYIGSLLLWKGKKESFDSLFCQTIYGFANEEAQTLWSDSCGNPDYIVLDGQQRLTALYYALVAPEVALPKAKRMLYYIRVDKFMEEEHDKAFECDRLSQHFSKIMRSPEAQYAEHIFPLSVIGKEVFAFSEWVLGYGRFWEEKMAKAESEGDTSTCEAVKQHVENGKKFREHFQGIIQGYQVAYIELDKELEINKVCDIFTKINSTGTPLDVFDLINALLKPKGLQLKYMWQDVSPRLEFIKTKKMNVYILQVMSILCQAYCSPKYLYYLLPGQEKQIRTAGGEWEKRVLVPDAEDFVKRWKDAVESIEHAINLLKDPREFGAITYQYLPYTSILPVFAALQFICRNLPKIQQMDAQRKIRQWYWASVFTNRYSGSVESTSARDFLDVEAWVKGDGIKPALLQEFSNRNLDLRAVTKKARSIYNGIFNLLVLQEARDWITQKALQPDNLDDHHIVPVSWCKKNNIKKGDIDTILNRTLLSSETNREVIRDRLPNEYLPELINRNGEDAVRPVLESHFISLKAQNILLRDTFGVNDYEEFIAERQHTILEAVENLLIKERLNLSMPLRELDQDIEKVELRLRAAIGTTLNNDVGQLPPHIAQKIDECIDKVVKKNVAVGIENYEKLTSRLEFTTLSDLKDIITSKITWAHFKSCFVNKETLNSKFNQLIEIRNSIRHSRTANEITRKEGEAAILWFKEVLEKRGFSQRV